MLLSVGGTYSISSFLASDEECALSRGQQGRYFNADYIVHASLTASVYLPARPSYRHYYKRCSVLAHCV